jgi:glycosyltransferase involved in cell wall biosynthesis
MSAVDIVVHSSITPEPFGRVIVESMLAERPVIATRAGGALEIVEHGRTGLLITPNDPAALTTAIVDLMANPKRAASLARNGRRSAEYRFAPNVVIPALEQHIVEAAEGRRAAMPKLTLTPSGPYASRPTPSREVRRL